ncbi:MAG TPA: hypothetical protein VNW94_09395 [Streptosporangiaceae bacterium]|nr:hypothetical protein [Streptosporangiaceae bacterium]
MISSVSPTDFGLVLGGLLTTVTVVSVTSVGSWTFLFRSHA